MKKIGLIFRAAAAVAGVYFLLMFLAPLYAGILNIGNIIGISLSCLVITASLLWDRIVRFVKSNMNNKKFKAAFLSLTSLFAVGLTVFFISLGAVVSCDSTNANGQKTVIVLGCAVYDEMPSIMLYGRTEAAADYLLENPDAVAILSGGMGDGESITEAECMRRIMNDKGVPDSRLIIEDKSTSTAENMRYSKELIEEYGLDDDVAIVSSSYHLRRAALLAERNGLKNPKRISVRTDKYSTMTFCFRDAAALIFEFVLRR